MVKGNKNKKRSCGYSFVNQPLLTKNVYKKAKELILKDNSYLDKYTFFGHYPIGVVDTFGSHGPHLITNLGEYYDATHYWMTSCIDFSSYPELTNTSTMSFLGKLALEALTMSEMNNIEQTMFVEMMRNFWPSAKHVLTFSEGARGVVEACSAASQLVAERDRFQPVEAVGVSFLGAFHGRYDRAGDATDPDNHKVAFRQQKERIIYCPSPTVHFDEEGNILREETDRNLRESLKSVEAAFKKDNVAYVITEYPFQAEGGGRLLNPLLLKFLYELCQRYKKLLIVDCVQMGGRVWFKRRKGEVVPFPKEALRYADIITFGKVFRACGFMAKDPTKLRRGFKVDVIKSYPERFGSTWVSTPAQCFAGVILMEVIKKYKLWENGLKMTQYALNSFRKIARRYKGIMISPRGRKDTSYIAFDLPTEELRKKFVEMMRDNYHILMLGAGKTAIRWAPALDISKEEVDKICTAIQGVLSHLQQYL
jgi:4-aminobutyrate aminotransferase-like enzyme